MDETQAQGDSYERNLWLSGVPLGCGHKAGKDIFFTRLLGEVCRGGGCCAGIHWFWLAWVAEEGVR